MRRRVRLGIKRKLLLFYGSVIAIIVALELWTQAAAYRSGREFEERLARYHAVHGLRVQLAEHRELGDRYLRELLPAQLETLRGGLVVLGQMAEELEPYGEESLEAYFEVRATRRGIEAYLPLAALAYDRREALLPDYYQSFARAERIAAYVDGYLSKLLSLSMEAGRARYREAAARSSLSRKLALAGVLTAGALSLLFSAFFASSITAPIRRLALASERIAAGELEVEPVRAETGDEVETLARGFNAMAENIRDLVEGLREKAELEGRLHDEEIALVSMGRALREAQFMYLQDQMRPHFLFNAINTISRSALLEGAAGTERLALGLGRLMRYSLIPGGSFVPLREELGVLREYLEFQSIRFGARLSWKIEADEGLEGLLLPRFTLQPLVENAVRHGIEPKEPGGTVHVRARRRSGRVRILVADTGMGIDPSLLARLRSSGLAAPRPEPEGEGSERGVDGSGLGLANLSLRLALRYGEGARVGISSAAGRGTVVRISIPEGQARDA